MLIEKNFRVVSEIVFESALQSDDGFGRSRLLREGTVEKARHLRPVGRG